MIFIELKDTRMLVENVINAVGVIVWACVVIFVITAILTLLHVSGVRPLPNPEHGKVLFKALIIEIVVVAVGVFANITSPDNIKPYGNIPSSMGQNRGPVLDVNQTDKPSLLLLKPSPVIESPLTETVGDNCHKITVSDGFIYPPTSHIETICN